MGLWKSWLSSDGFIPDECRQQLSIPGYQSTSLFLAEVMKCFVEAGSKGAYEKKWRLEMSHPK